MFWTGYSREELKGKTQYLSFFFFESVVPLISITLSICATDHCLKDRKWREIQNSTVVTITRAGPGHNNVGICPDGLLRA